jgi:hypothetical protein
MGPDAEDGPTREVWHLAKRARHARCVVAAHPFGLEPRCVVDDELLRSAVFRETEALQIEAYAWLERSGRPGGRRSTITDAVLGA